MQYSAVLCSIYYIIKHKLFSHTNSLHLKIIAVRIKLKRKQVLDLLSFIPIIIKLTRKMEYYGLPYVKGSVRYKQSPEHISPPPAPKDGLNKKRTNSLQHVNTGNSFIIFIKSTDCYLCIMDCIQKPSFR